jgi:hypothetical protein
LGVLDRVAQIADCKYCRPQRATAPFLLIRGGGGGGTVKVEKSGGLVSPVSINDLSLIAARKLLAVMTQPLIPVRCGKSRPVVLDRRSLWRS